jgi:hypothetical protein
VSLQVIAAEGELANLPAPTGAGLHAVVWKPDRLAPGEYTVRLAAAGQVIVKKLRVERERVEAAE